VLLSSVPRFLAFLGSFSGWVLLLCSCRPLLSSGEFGGGWWAAFLGDFCSQQLSGSYPANLSWWFVTYVVVVLGVTCGWLLLLLDSSWEYGDLQEPPLYWVEGRFW
jgi:hypothetical protein